MNLLSAEQALDPCADIVAGRIDFSGVAGGWRVHLDTVAAVGAVRGACALRGLVCLTDSGPLPGVLNTISKVSIGSHSIEAALADGGLVALREAYHAEPEDAFAHCGPKVHIEVRRTHALRLVLRGGLEPAVLSTVLVSPLASGSSEVNFSFGQLTCVVVRRINASNLSAKLRDKLKDLLVALVLVCCEHRAQVGSVAVLDRLDKDICVVEHKVIGAHAG